MANRRTHLTINDAHFLQVNRVVELRIENVVRGRRSFGGYTPFGLSVWSTLGCSDCSDLLDLSDGGIPPLPWGLNIGAARFACVCFYGVAGALEPATCAAG